MSVLDDAVGEQRAERHHAIAIEHDKNDVRSRFGYQSYENGGDHAEYINAAAAELLDPCLDVSDFI